MPHAHILLILEEQDKIRTSEDVDRVVCAEIPFPITQPQLYETVTKCMNHGHCGLLKPNAKCMVDKKCSKHYPKDFQDATSMVDDGYPKYRRRNDNRTFISSSGETCDNRHIVPYNPVLSTIFNCHINVEVCSSVQAVKYIYKYIYKGIIYFNLIFLFLIKLIKIF